MTKKRNASWGQLGRNITASEHKSPSGSKGSGIMSGMIGGLSGGSRPTKRTSKRHGGR